MKLNTPYLEFYEALLPGAADHVLCQELGHVLGLDHNRLELDTCMNDQAPLGSATAPNLHDVQQLNLIYNHADAGGGGGRGRAGAGAPSGNGRWLTVHVFPMP